MTTGANPPTRKSAAVDQCAARRKGALLKARVLLVLVACAALAAAPGFVFGQGEDDADHNDELFDLMAALVVAHDAGIIAGLFPTPLIQYTGESVEFAGNLGLKALPPWLEAPDDLSVDPLAPVPSKASTSSSQWSTR